MAVANSSTSRFGKANENDINDILQSKDSKNTKNATKVALQTLTAYIIEADKEVNLCDCSPPPEQLAELPRNFYIDVRKKDGTSYKLSAFKRTLL